MQCTTQLYLSVWTLGTCPMVFRGRISMNDEWDPLGAEWTTYYI